MGNATALSNMVSSAAIIGKMTEKMYSKDSSNEIHSSMPVCKLLVSQLTFMRDATIIYSQLMHGAGA